MITIRSLLQYSWLAILVVQASAIPEVHGVLQDKRGLVRDAPIQRRGGEIEERNADAKTHINLARSNYDNANQNANPLNPSQSSNPNPPGNNNGGKWNPNMGMPNSPGQKSKDTPGGGQAATVTNTQYMTVTKTVTKAGKCPPPMMTGCPPPVLALTECPIKDATVVLTTTVGNNNCQLGQGKEMVSTVTKIKKVTAVQTDVAIQTQTMALAACPPPVIEVTTVPGLCAPPVSTTQQAIDTTSEANNNQVVSTTQAADSQTTPPPVDQFGNLIGTSSSLQIGGDISLLTAASKRQVSTPAIEIVTGSSANGAQVTPGLPPPFSGQSSSVGALGAGPQDQSLSPSLPGVGNANQGVGLQQMQGQVSCPATLTITATQPCAVTTTINSCSTNGLGSNNNNNNNGGGGGGVVSSPTGLSVVAVSTGASNNNNNAAAQTAGCFITNDPNFRPGMATIPMSIATLLGNQITAETATGGMTAQITSMNMGNAAATATGGSGGSLQTTAASIVLLSNGPGGMMSTATVCSAAQTSVPIGMQTLPKTAGSAGAPGSKRRRARIVG